MKKPNITKEEFDVIKKDLESLKGALDVDSDTDEKPKYATKEDIESLTKLITEITESQLSEPAKASLSEDSKKILERIKNNV